MPTQVISPGQALLMLMDHHKNDKSKLETLKKLYLLGLHTPEDEALFSECSQDPILSEFQISKDKNVINNDPTRRYFETHLAYETLKSSLNEIDIDALQTHYNNLEHEINYFNYNVRHGVRTILKGRPEDEEIEYSYSIARIARGEIFEDLTPQDRQKLELIVKISFLGVVNASDNIVPLPLDIYNTGIYSYSARGKTLKSNQDSTRNSALGLLKGEMPIAQDDIAHSKTIPPFLKPSDQSDFQDNAQWVESNFKQLVHPFSNSISGTVLGQIRTVASFNKWGSNSLIDSTEKIRVFFKHFIATRLFINGGHTLNEYSSPFSIAEVKTYFDHLNLPDVEKINIESMFYTGNETAFNQALDDAIKYNNQIIQRQNVRAALLSNPKKVSQEKLTALDEKIAHNRSAQIRSDLKLSSLSKEADSASMKQTEHADNKRQFHEQLKVLSRGIETTKANYTKKNKFIPLSSRHALINKGLTSVLEDVESLKLRDAKIKISTLINNVYAKKSKKGTSYQMLTNLEAKLDKLISIQSKLSNTESQLKEQMADFKKRYHTIQTNEEPSSPVKSNYSRSQP